MEVLATLVRSKLDSEYPDISEITNIEYNDREMEIKLPGNIVCVNTQYLPRHGNNWRLGVDRYYMVDGTAVARCNDEVRSNEVATEAIIDRLNCSTIKSPGFYKICASSIFVAFLSVLIWVCYKAANDCDRVYQKSDRNVAACLAISSTMGMLVLPVCLFVAHGMMKMIRDPVRVIERRKYIRTANIPIPIREEILEHL